MIISWLFFSGFLLLFIGGIVVKGGSKLLQFDNLPCGFVVDMEAPQSNVF